MKIMIAMETWSGRGKASSLIRLIDEGFERDYESRLAACCLTGNSLAVYKLNWDDKKQNAEDVIC